MPIPSPDALCGSRDKMSNVHVIKMIMTTMAAASRKALIVKKDEEVITKPRSKERERSVGISKGLARFTVRRLKSGVAPCLVVHAGRIVNLRRFNQPLVSENRFLLLRFVTVAH